MKETTEQKIERLVKEYSKHHTTFDEEILKLELECLVIQAQLEIKK